MDTSTDTHEVPNKWRSIVRVKPLSDKEIINSNETQKDKHYKGAEGDTITMTHASGEETYTLDKVIHPKED